MVSDSKNISLVLGGAALAALGVAAYYKFVKADGGEVGELDFSNIHAVTKEQLGALLDEIIENQASMKKVMSELQSDIVKNDLSFEQVCEEVSAKANSLISPLEKYNLSVGNFSQLLSGFNSDASIRQKIVALTEGGDLAGNSAASGEKVDMEPLLKRHNFETVIDIHSFMLQRLKEIMTTSRIKKLTSARLATIATQAYVGKLVQVQYGIASNELEALAAHFSRVLSQDERFLEIGAELRHTLGKLTELCSEGGGNN